MNVEELIDTARTLVAGDGQLVHEESNSRVGKSDVLLLPAMVIACDFWLRGAVSLLEISLPKGM